MGPQQRALNQPGFSPPLLASSGLSRISRRISRPTRYRGGGGGGGRRKKIEERIFDDVEELGILDAIEAARERIRETSSKYREGDTSTLQGIKENKVSRENLQMAERADERMMMTTNMTKALKRKTKQTQT